MRLQTSLEFPADRPSKAAEAIAELRANLPNATIRTETVIKIIVTHSPRDDKA